MSASAPYSTSTMTVRSQDVPPVPRAKMGDDVCVQHALAGDAEALERLLTQVRPRLYRVALRLLRSKEDAEDAVQELFIDDTPSSENQTMPMGIVDSHPDPEQNCAWNETRMVVEEAMNDLPPAMRSAFQLREIYDLSNADAARASGVRLGAFKSRISRARTQLAARLEPSAIAPLQKFVPASFSWESPPSGEDSR